MLAFCFAIFGVFGVVLVLVGANQDALAKALGIGLAASGLLTSLLALGIGSGMALGGPLADRLPRRALAGGAVLVAVAALLGVSHDMSFGRLCLHVFALGAGAGVANIVFNLVIVERYGDGAARRLLVLHSAATLGAIAGPGLVAALGDAGAWTPSFRAIGVAYLAVWIWLWFVPFGDHGASPPPTAGAPDRRLELAALCVTAFAYLGVEACIGVFAVPYAIDGLGLPGDRGRAAISAFWLGLLAGRLGVLLWRGSLDARLLIGCGLTATCVLAAVAFEWSARIEWLLGAAGFATGPVFPLLVALAARTSASRPGLATGWLAGFGSLGGFSLPWAAGVIGDAHGVAAIFSGLAGATLLLAASAAAAYLLRAGLHARPAEDPKIGLCSSCRHARRTANRRGSEFWQCLRAESDPDFRRYPELPVAECSGHEPST